ncbi:Transmembrane emp24 domain-containing protein 5 [Camelus dromedarius]|uniref:Transmembrane emp24 domain-containing protein 5 n=1 Tax=Camelus dromedarius TaxID=9838 RepID=A0A5N4DUJ0_CAMDR|nr:Transmembrane emp24 domain-containing protein 5 [Camelus dromedarius]
MGCQVGGADAGPAGAEVREGVHADGGLRPQPPPSVGRRFPREKRPSVPASAWSVFSLRVSLPALRSPGGKGGAEAPGTPPPPRLFQPEVGPAGMGGEIWLPFPVVLLGALLLPGAAGFTPSLDSDFTFTLPAGQKECFYQPMPLKASLEIEYQVLDGAGLDIDFHLASPEGRTLVFEQRRSDGVHTIETEVGDYMFCFDNTFSTISEKESINSIKSRLSKSGHIQTLLRAFEARDRNIQESNFDRVNFWSMVNLVVMVVVSAIQVYMLKSLFEDKRKSRT